MCLTLEALVAFMALLPMNIIETDVDRITIHAESQDAVWTANGNMWCVEPPRIDVARLKSENLVTPQR